MTDNNFADGMRHEGDMNFDADTNAEGNASDSQSGKENQDGDTHSNEGDNTHADDKTPFHHQARWKERETEWNDRFNDQEQRYQEDLKKIREEFTATRKTDEQNTRIPAWFGGTEEQWKEYRADKDAELNAAEERAEKRVLDKMKNDKGSEEKAVADATEYLRSEITAIESDKTLNPSGSKIDAEKLLKVVLENELIDAKGRWNYRAGWRILKNETSSSARDTKVAEKKEIAGVTVNSGKGDGKSTTVATSETFKKNKPW